MGKAPFSCHFFSLTQNMNTVCSQGSIKSTIIQCQLFVHLPKKMSIAKTFRQMIEWINWMKIRPFVCMCICVWICVSVCNFCSVWNVEFRFQYFLFLSLSISLAPFRCVITSTRAPFLVYFCFTYLIYCCRFLSRWIMIQRARVNFVMFIQCFEVIYCLF